MRRPDLWRGLELGVAFTALAATGLLGWVAFRAATGQTVPRWAWAVIASATVVGLAVMSLQGGRHGVHDGSIRHSSGELVIVRGYRERRQRQTRIALDWKYGVRWYLFVVLALVMALSGGFGLLGSQVWWQQVGGVVVIGCVLAATAALVRWLLLPVDADSKARLDAFYEEMKWDWGGLGRRVRQGRHR